METSLENSIWESVPRLAFAVEDEEPEVALEPWELAVVIETVVWMIWVLSVGVAWEA
jgi:hypothetical protein